MPKKIPRFVPIILILAIVGAAFYYFYWVKRDESGPLTASGTVEAVEIVIASEIGGQIAEVFVDEGDRVQAGDVLIRFENDMLVAQQNQAQAALDQAQANYQLISSQLLEQRQVAITAAELEVLHAKQLLQDLIDNANLARADAQRAVDDAEQALEDLLDPELQQAMALETIAMAEKTVDDAETRLRIVNSTASQADIDAAKATVVLAKDALDKAKKDFKPYEGKSEENLIRANLQSKLAAAQNAYDAAVRRLNALAGTGSEVDISIAEADLVTAWAQLAKAQRDYDRIKDGPRDSDIAFYEAQLEKARKKYKNLENGPDPDDLNAAQARVANAEANLALAQTDTTQEQLDIAQAQVNAAKAALEIIQVQLDKSQLIAPIDGTVLFQFVQVGEAAMPGATAVIVGTLDELSITVYVPEDRYGEINLGDEVAVSVDTFPGETFSADVVRIADVAEYTPRNVQTAEGRRSTVFAIELAVTNVDGKLKPGMPADVEFKE